MGLAALEVLPIAALALIAATAVVALRCLDPEEAYGAIRWNILMLIFGMLAVGIAMDKTGAARLIVERSEEHTSELQSLMRTSYAVICIKKQNNTKLTLLLLHTQHFDYITPHCTMNNNKQTHEQ